MLAKAYKIIRDLFPAEISHDEFGILIIMDDAAAPLIGRLYKSGKITARDRDVLRSAMQAERKRKAKAVLSGVDRKLSRRGSPEVQAGLPSLGKRRP